MFKKHRLLPRPRDGSASGSTLGGPDSSSRRSSSGSGSQRYATNLPLVDFFSPLLCADGSGSHVASIHTLRHQRRKLSGVELPPTPPAHSRNSSSSHSVALSSLSPVHTPAQSSEDVQSRPSPSTPPNQRSPPTPEVTPPRTEARHKAALSSRPSLSHRIPSKSTTRTDSRTESFRTALESPEGSDEEGEIEEDEEEEDDDDEDEDEEGDSRSTLRPAPPSTRTSQITVRQLHLGDRKSRSASRTGSGADVDSLDHPRDQTPHAKVDFDSFDGEWGLGSEVEQEWDDNLSRVVTVRKRRAKTHSSGHAREATGDETVSPTNVTRPVRAFPLQGRVLTYDSSQPSRRSVTAPEAASADPPAHSDARRLSGMSTRSNASTVVEAMLVGTPPPQRKTLRHVKRVDALRDSIWQPSPSSQHGSVPSLQESTSRRRLGPRTRDAPRDSYASNSTVNTISSRKARRDVRKSGGIPVVVIPDRQSSNRSNSQERSLRSVSSQRSKRSQSVSSVPPPQVPSDNGLTSYFDRPPRRSRRTSESDGSLPGDQRTIDFPPTVPRRTSSLSASTGRNASRETSRHGSRAGSLTAESLKAHNDSTLAESAVQAESRQPAVLVSSTTESSVPAVTVDSTPSYDQLKDKTASKDSDDDRRRTLDTLMGSPHMSMLATPFSVASVDTNLTAAEISQAMAVRIMPHQNRSVVMVDNRPSESSDGDRESQSNVGQGQPTITTTEVFGAYEEEPVTPQTEYPLQLNNVDSPLRNPRAPPEPPVLQFIPATPSGLTPAEEKPRLLGNFYDETKGEEKPARGFAKVRRALTKRRNSYGPSPNRDARPGLLTRTLSLSKTVRKEPEQVPDVGPDDDVFYDDEPRDQSRLHPNWRPSHYPGYYGDDEDFDGENEDEIIMRYPPIDNRPRLHKRSLSERMKRTFAIMPIQDDHDDYMHNETERRTIRRTPSGNLRVVKHRGSVGSLRDEKNRTATKPPEKRRGPIFPRSNKFTRRRRAESESDTDSQAPRLRRTWSLTQSVHDIPRKISEKRREKRSNELRQKISGPRDFRDGVDDVIRRDGLRGTFQHQQHRPRRSEDVDRI